MNVSEQDKREGIAGELADIFRRQTAIVECNSILQFNVGNSKSNRFQKMAEEDEKVLKMLESVINSFGIRVAPKSLAETMSETLIDTVSDESITPLEQLSFYTLTKQNQMMCCHLVHKSAQVSAADIKLALTPFEGIYATFSKQVAELMTLTEEFGVEWLTGEKPAGGITGRMRDAVATVMGAVLSKTAKPFEEMNVMDVLTVEHRKVDALFKEIETADSHEEAKGFFTQLKADLTAHSIAEEDTVYSTFKKFADSKEKMDDGQAEHMELRTLLDEISFVSDNEEEFMTRVELLKSKVKHHVREEESTLYNLIESHSTEEEQIALSKAFLDEKRMIQLNVGTDEIASSAANDSTQTMTIRTSSSSSSSASI
jgi:hemerythrin superfamily protein